MRLPVADIRLDGGTQIRVAVDHVYIAELAEIEGLPPVTAFYDGEFYWLADGFHRTLAAKQAGKTEIEVDVKQGSRRDAVLYAVESNHSHGLRRTNADKRRAVTTLLNDAEWAEWVDREIARRCGVGHHLVADVRASLGAAPSEVRTYTTKHGTTTKMRTTNIGKTPQPDAQPPEQDGQTAEAEKELWEGEELRPSGSGATPDTSDKSPKTRGSEADSIVLEKGLETIDAALTQMEGATPKKEDLNGIVVTLRKCSKRITDIILNLQKGAV